MKTSRSSSSASRRSRLASTGGWTPASPWFLASTVLLAFALISSATGMDSMFFTVAAIAGVAAAVPGAAFYFTRSRLGSRFGRDRS